MYFQRLFGSLNLPFSANESSSCSERIIKLLLQSGLMLDEDMQLFFATWDNYGIIVSEDNNISKLSSRKNIELILYIASLTSFSVHAYRRDVKSSLLWLMPVLGIKFTKLLRYVKVTANEQSIRYLIQNINTLIQVNKSIVTYLKRRKSLSTLNGTILFNAFTKDIEQLIKVATQANMCIIRLFKTKIEKLVSYMPDEEGQFLLAKSPQCLEATSVVDIDGGISLLENASDIFLLLQSELIFCLAFVFALSSWKNQSTSTSTIIKMVWEMNATFKRSHKEIERQFEETKYSVNFRSDIQHKPERTQESAGSPNQQIVHIKFRQAFEDCIIQLGILMEKSKFAFAKSNDLGKNKDLTELTVSIADLKKHNQQLYETLEFLCNTYCILIKSEAKKEQVSQKDQNENTDKEPTDSKPSTSSHAIQSINYNDPDETLEDEEYEIYIDSNEIYQPESSYSGDVLESGATMSLLLMELKQAMLKDTRFQAARKKRGIIDDESIKCNLTKQTQEPMKAPPDVLPDSCESSPDQTEGDKPMRPPPLPPPLPTLQPPPPSPLQQKFLPSLQSPLPPSTQTTPLLPPAPPTTPLLPHSFSGDICERPHNEDHLVNLAFIDKIRMASSQHKCVEETFGESDLDDEEAS